MIDISKSIFSLTTIMKKMTCKQLWWACDMEFYGEDFESIGNMCKQHVMEVKDDPAHQQAMQEMMSLDPQAQQARYATRKAEFDELPHI